MSHDEKRFIRREWISYYLKGNKCIYGTPINLRDAVRISESWLFGLSLNIY